MDEDPIITVLSGRAFLLRSGAPTDGGCDSSPTASVSTCFETWIGYLLSLLSVAVHHPLLRILGLIPAAAG
jgi:hypothetical protein